MSAHLLAWEMYIHTSGKQSKKVGQAFTLDVSLHTNDTVKQMQSN
jgi:hypothetical protein